MRSLPADSWALILGPPAGAGERQQSTVCAHQERRAHQERPAPVFPPGKEEIAHSLCLDSFLSELSCSFKVSAAG